MSREENPRRLRNESASEATGRSPKRRGTNAREPMPAAARAPYARPTSPGRSSKMTGSGEPSRPWPFREASRSNSRRCDSGSSTPVCHTVSSLGDAKRIVTASASNTLPTVRATRVSTVRSSRDSPAASSTSFRAESSRLRNNTSSWSDRLSVTSRISSTTATTLPSASRSGDAATSRNRSRPCDPDSRLVLRPGRPVAQTSETRQVPSSRTHSPCPPHRVLEHCWPTSSSRDRPVDARRAVFTCRMVPSRATICISSVRLSMTACRYSLDACNSWIERLRSSVFSCTRSSNTAFQESISDSAAASLSRTVSKALASRRISPEPTAGTGRSRSPSAMPSQASIRRLSGRTTLRPASHVNSRAKTNRIPLPHSRGHCS